MNFPRSQRFVVTEQLQKSVLDFQELLVDANANRGSQRAQKLAAADAELVKTRLYLRLCQKWAWMTMGQYEHASVMIAEIGRLLGGWKKSVTTES